MTEKTGLRSQILKSMNFRTAISLAALAAIPGFAADFGSEFAKHWTTAKELTVAVAETMPDADYGFKPNPDEMSFGEQIVHIANANYIYCSRVAGSKSPFVKPETNDKATAIKLVNESFAYCAETLAAVKDFDKQVGPMGVREVLLGAYAHMAHHRGQAEVYLRVKGLKPPTYKF